MKNSDKDLLVYSFQIEAVAKGMNEKAREGKFYMDNGMEKDAEEKIRDIREMAYAMAFLGFQTWECRREDAPPTYILARYSMKENMYKEDDDSLDGELVRIF